MPDEHALVYVSHGVVVRHDKLRALVEIDCLPQILAGHIVMIDFCAGLVA